MDHFHTRAPFVPEPVATPLNSHTPAMRQDAAVNTAENKGLQQDATALPLHEPASPDYIISVDQVRARLAERGLQKSKDTIQRWCRSGDLDCKKQGFLNRYFTTEGSLVALEKRLLPDMVADRIGEVSSSIQLHAVEDQSTAESMKVREPAKADERTRTQVQEGDATAARSDLRVEPLPDAAACSSVPQQSEMREENAALKAEVKVLREMIGKFEKFTDQAVEDKQLTLETFQTMALGGRLERRNSKTGDGEVIRPTSPSST